MTDSLTIGSERWFVRYVELFNQADFAGFGAYYAPDVEFAGRAATLRGREAVLDFYRNIRSRLDERIECLSFIGSEQRCAAEICTTLTPHEDWPDFPTGPLLKWVKRQSVNFVFYDMEAGLFQRIRSAGFRRLA
ncbi:DUF4440 domain-containing protein [Altererythrobacter indicus]|uniref:DUF4440 domain-containing protein n=1 Tax=Altericroceibacterium indicum TaxID=374177 RepID=A0A845A3W7_9SPHN|nr:DUF4440 domain-containing protein [Altericroceibacterium indicum]